jgi:hypothetical protein
MVQPNTFANSELRKICIKRECVRPIVCPTLFLSERIPEATLALMRFGRTWSWCNSSSMIRYSAFEEKVGVLRRSLRQEQTRGEPVQSEGQPLDVARDAANSHLNVPSADSILWSGSWGRSKLASSVWAWLRALISREAFSKYERACLIRSRSPSPA